jgi:hypothetical protein
LRLDRNAHPPGTVLIPCHDQARFHQFTNDMVVLDVPDGTQILIMRSASIIQNMNMGVASMNDDSAWLLVLGDDHAFGRDFAVRLLEHNLDIVAPLCTRRSPPFGLVAFDQDSDEKDEYGRSLMHSLQYEDIPDEGGLLEVVATGSAGMLIRRGVLDALGPPWFQNTDGLSTDEDVNFCRRARELGYQIWLDTDTPIGHISQFTAWPIRREEAGLVLDFMGQGVNKIFIPGGMQPGVEHGVADVLA